MTATLSRRVAKLEAAQPPPPPDDGDDDGEWWRGAPEPVLRYLLALCQGAAGDPAVPAGDPAALAAALHARHPALSDVMAFVGRHRRPDEPYTLRQLQREVLTAAMMRLSFHIVRTTPGVGHGPDADERTSRRLLDVEYRRIGQRPDPAHPTGSACYYDRSGETFVRQWRATGTRDPETLAVLGFGAPELALLAADE